MKEFKGIIELSKQTIMAIGMQIRCMHMIHKLQSKQRMI